MRRVVLYLVCLISFNAANAQFLDKKAFEANRKWSIGLMGAYLHFPNDVTRGAAGFNLTIKGFYLDLMGHGSSHKRDVEYKKWSDNTAMAVHVGYQIPLFKSFRIIPIAGYAYAGKTKTDGTNWTTDSSGIINSESYSSDASGFDAGGLICVNIKKLNLYFGATKHIYAGGVGIQF